MKQYECDLCGYVYDEAARPIRTTASPPAPSGRTCPADWVCPLCGAGKDEFTPLSEKKSRVQRTRDFFFAQSGNQMREEAIRPFSAGTLGRTRSSREPRMKQAAASPIPTVRELKANAGQKAAPSWVENQAISAPTSTILQITGGQGRQRPVMELRCPERSQQGGRRTHDPVQRNGRTQEVGQETADGKTGDGLGNRKGRTVMASATRNWMPAIYWGMGSSSVRAWRKWRR